MRDRDGAAEQLDGLLREVDPERVAALIRGPALPIEQAAEALLALLAEVQIGPEPPRERTEPPEERTEPPEERTEPPEERTEPPEAWETFEGTEPPGAVAEPVGFELGDDVAGIAVEIEVDVLGPDELDELDEGDELDAFADSVLDDPLLDRGAADPVEIARSHFAALGEDGLEDGLEDDDETVQIDFGALFAGEADESSDPSRES